MKLRRLKTRDYTTVNNGIVRDRRITLKSKGLFLTIMALPEDWDFSIPGITSILKERRDAVYAAIDELIRFGYCERHDARDDFGQFTGTNYSFHETPIKPEPDKPDTGNPDTGIPDTENPPQYKNKDKEYKKEEKNKESASQSLSGAPLNLPKKRAASAADEEIAVWMSALAPIVGAKSPQTMADRRKWLDVCTSCVREQRDMIKFLAAVATAVKQTEPQFFSPGAVLKQIQLAERSTGSNAATGEKLYNGRRLGEIS